MTRRGSERWLLWGVERGVEVKPDKERERESG